MLLVELTQSLPAVIFTQGVSSLSSLILLLPPRIHSPQSSQQSCRHVPLNTLQQPLITLEPSPLPRSQGHARLPCHLHLGPLFPRHPQRQRACSPWHTGSQDTEGWEERGIRVSGARSSSCSHLGRKRKDEIHQGRSSQNRMKGRFRRDPESLSRGVGEDEGAWGPLVRPARS